MAMPAALASIAADKQGKFWEYHDKLFAEDKIVPESIERIASEIGLDMEQFNRDRQSAEAGKIVGDDFAEARNFGVTGTPTIYINGRKLQQRSLQGFQQMINSAASGSAGKK